MTPNRAARVIGVSKSWGYELHQGLGRVYRPPGTTYCERYLDREQRYELARLHDANVSMRKIAAALGVQPSTVSRELKRNRDPATGRYQPERADRMAWERQRGLPRPRFGLQRPSLGDGWNDDRQRPA